MKLMMSILVLTAFPAVAVAQNHQPTVTSQFGLGNPDAAPRSPYVPELSRSVSTPTMMRQAEKRAIALRARIDYWVAKDGGTLSEHHQRAAIQEVREIRSLMGHYMS